MGRAEYEITIIISICYVTQIIFGGSAQGDYEAYVPSENVWSLLVAATGRIKMSFLSQERVR